MNTVRYRAAFLLLVVFAASRANAQDAAAAARDPSGAEVCFMPFSHLDFYWGGTREECLARGNEVASLCYPPPGAYVFRYLLSPAAGDWRASKAYRAGMGCNNPLLPVSVVDAISAKSLPPTYSFASVKQDSVVLSAEEIRSGPIAAPARLRDRRLAPPDAGGVPRPHAGIWRSEPSGRGPGRDAATGAPGQPVFDQDNQAQSWPP